MSKKKIGIYAASVGENSFGVSKTYLEFIRKIGYEPMILLPQNTFEKSIDMLLLPGGMDINPNSYGDVPGFFTSNTDVHKQYVYDKCLPNYINEKTPVFGICLGFQQLASYFGLKLEQDLVYHEQSPQRWATAHEVWLTPEGLDFYMLEKAPKIEVNSHHHQAVIAPPKSKSMIVDDINGFTPLLWAKNHEYATQGGIVEAFRHKDFAVAGVQWHPEELYDLYSITLLNETMSRKP